MFADALKILDSKEKIPYVTKMWLPQLWRRKESEWSSSSNDSPKKFKSKETKWEVVLDIDALGKAEGESWYTRATALRPDPSTGEDEPTLCRVLLRLSRGGADATVVREFDLFKGKFVVGGFVMPEAKSFCCWKDLNTLRRHGLREGIRTAVSTGESGKEELFLKLQKSKRKHRRFCDELHYKA